MQKFSDFVVREINPSGVVASLQSLEHSVVESVFRSTKNSSASVPSDDAIAAIIREFSVLVELSQDTIDALQSFLTACFRQDADCEVDFTAFACTDKEMRGQAHGIIRSNAKDYIDSDTVQVDGVSHIRLLAKHKQSKKNQKFRQRDAWPEGVGEYLKFKLLKENIDTMSAVNYLSKKLRFKPESMYFAGTKDKRAVTVQWCTMHKRKPSSLVWINNMNFYPRIRIGDFEYVKEPVRLGELSGNRFEILLREVSATPVEAAAACEAIKASGFINYFGLQRFGKGSTGSHIMGALILRRQWKEAVDANFTERRFDRDDIAKCKKLYREGDVAEALKCIPQVMHSEKKMLQVLSAAPSDFNGAYRQLPRNTRLLCIHALQSFVWNRAATERIKRYGLEVVEGDLVLSTPPCDFDVEDVNNDEVVSLQTPDTSAVHLVSAEDIANKTYTIRDVVLPLVGKDIIFPQNEIKDVCLTSLGEMGVSMNDFSSHPDNICRLGGSYRSLMGYASDFEYVVLPYSDRHEELVSTEMNRFYSSQSKRSEETSESAPTASNGSAGAGCENSKYNALLLKFSLRPGMYATMFLRELTKESTESEVHIQRTMVSNNNSAGEEANSEDVASDNVTDAEQPKKRQRSGSVCSPERLQHA